MLLYIFIATPVQLWHHHKVSNQKAGALKISTATVETKSEDCKICQHTYAAYINDDVCFSFAINNIFSDNGSFFEPVYPEVDLYNISNKSPPLV